MEEKANFMGDTHRLTRTHTDKKLDKDTAIRLVSFNIDLTGRVAMLFLQGVGNGTDEMKFKSQEKKCPEMTLAEHNYLKY